MFVGRGRRVSPGDGDGPWNLKRPEVNRGFSVEPPRSALLSLNLDFNIIIISKCVLICCQRNVKHITFNKISCTNIIYNIFKLLNNINFIEFQVK